MVRLDGATGNQGVRALRKGIGDQELELSRLIAAGRQTEKVIPLDENVRSSDRGGKSRNRFIGVIPSV